MFVGSPSWCGARNPASRPFGPRALESHPPPRGPWALCSQVQSRGYAVYWRDSLGATVYDQTGRSTRWRLVRDEVVVVPSESAAWEVAVTWSGLLWAVAPRPWSARERAALTSAYLPPVAEWVVLLLLPARGCGSLQRGPHGGGGGGGRALPLWRPLLWPAPRRTPHRAPPFCGAPGWVFRCADRTNAPPPHGLTYGWCPLLPPAPEEEQA